MSEFVSTLVKSIGQRGLYLPASLERPVHEIGAELLDGLHGILQDLDVRMLAL
jgi:hypothetical protein